MVQYEVFHRCMLSLFWCCFANIYFPFLKSWKRAVSRVISILVYVKLRTFSAGKMWTFPEISCGMFPAFMGVFLLFFLLQLLGYFFICSDQLPVRHESNLWGNESRRISLSLSWASCFQVGLVVSGPLILCFQSCGSRTISHHLQEEIYWCNPD